MTVNKAGRMSTAIALTSACLMNATALADQPARKISIESGPLDTAIVELSSEANIFIFAAPEILRNKIAQAIEGRMTPEAALNQLLADSGLVFEQKVDGSYVVTQSDKAVEGDVDRQRDIERSSSIEEITVTAQKRKENIQDVAMGISVVDTETFLSAGLNNVKDVIAYTPGINYVNKYGGNRKFGNFITARGAGLTTLGNSPVAVYVDDVPLSSNMYFGRAGVTFYDGLLGEVERIEVLKGPQGTLYGSTSVGGAIRYVTRKPTLDEFRAKASIDFSNTADGGLNRLYNAKVSIPVLEDRLGITLSGFREEFAGFIDGVDVATGDVFEEDINNTWSEGYSADLYFMASDRLSFRAKIISDVTEWDETSMVYYDLASGAPLLGGNSAYASKDLRQNYYDAPTDVYNATLEYDLGWANFSWGVSQVETGQNYQSQAVVRLGSFIDSLEGNPAGTTTSIIGALDNKAEKLVHEVRLVSETGGKVEWILGYFYDDEEESQLGGYDIEPTGFIFYDFDVLTLYKEQAVYGNLTYYFTPDFDVTVGARHARVKTALEQEVYSEVWGDSDGLQMHKEQLSAFMFNTRYRFDENISLYARIASGYRPATSNIPFINPATGEDVAPFVRSDEHWSYEIGAKGEILSGELVYDVALWYNYWTDFQAQLTLPFGNNQSLFSTLANAESDIEAHGFEVSLIWRPVENLSIQPGVAYAYSVVAEEDSQIPAEKGARMPSLPELTASTTVRYEFMLGDLDAHLGGGFRYTSGTHTDFRSAIDVKSDNYILFDLNAGVDFGIFSVDLYAKNILNDDTYVFPIAPNTNGGRARPQTPRTVGIIASFDF